MTTNETPKHITARIFPGDYSVDQDGSIWFRSPQRGWLRIPSDGALTARTASVRCRAMHAKQAILDKHAKHARLARGR